MICYMKEAWSNCVQLSCRLYISLNYRKEILFTAVTYECMIMHNFVFFFVVLKGFFHFFKYKVRKILKKKK